MSPPEGLGDILFFPGRVYDGILVLHILQKKYACAAIFGLCDCHTSKHVQNCPERCCVTIFRGWKKCSTSHMDKICPSCPNCPYRICGQDYNFSVLDWFYIQICVCQVLNEV